MLIDDTTNDLTTAPAPAASLQWGGPAPEGVTLAWGARAIYSLKSHDTKRGPSRFTEKGRKPGRVITKAHTECMIDILHDRQSAIGFTQPDNKERATFERWLNTKAIPAIKRACVKDYITGDDDRWVTFESDGYAIKASPRASYGYLYLTAWKA
jgi:hypothetical protein